MRTRYYLVCVLQICLSILILFTRYVLLPNATVIVDRSAVCAFADIHESNLWISERGSCCNIKQWVWLT